MLFRVGYFLPENVLTSFSLDPLSSSESYSWTPPRREVFDFGNSLTWVLEPFLWLVSLKRKQTNFK
jgi:hypothetical protein